MFRTILTPLDGSPFSELALPFAEALAAAGDGQLVLLQATDPHTAPYADPVRAQIGAVDETDRYLRGIQRSVAHRAPATTAIYFGPAGAAIVDEIDIRRADLVVMASHGRSGPGRALFGSVADHVLRRASVPVLVVPARCDHTWPHARPVRILVPLDGSDFAEEVLGPVGDLVATFERGPGAEIVLVRIVDLSAAPLYRHGTRELLFDPDAAHEAARAYLATRAAALRAAAPRVSTHAAEGVPGTAIAEAARNLHADLIAMATHGRGGLRRVIMGSVATETLGHAHVPILFVRPAALRRRAAPTSVEHLREETSYEKSNGAVSDMRRRSDGGAPS